MIKGTHEMISNLTTNIIPSIMKVTLSQRLLHISLKYLIICLVFLQKEHFILLNNLVNRLQRLTMNNKLYKELKLELR